MKNFFYKISQPTIKNNKKYTHSQENISKNEISLPNSLKKLYLFCLNSNLNDELDGKKIKDILVAHQTKNIYSKYIEGFKILEGTLYYIDYKNKVLNIRYPSGKKEADKKYMYLKIKVSFKTDMNSFILENTYIIGAYFSNFKANITSSKQIKSL